MLYFRSHFLSLICFLIGALSSSVATAEVREVFRGKPGPETSITGYNVDGYPVLRIEGPLPIPPDDARTLAIFIPLVQALRSLPRANSLLVMIDSGGGANLVSETWSKQIRAFCQKDGKRKCLITTYVADNCSSACIPFYGRTGDYRIVAPSAKFGFHASRDSSTGELLSEEFSEEVYRGAGAKEEWLKTLKDRGVFRSADLTFFPAEDMVGVGIANEIAFSPIAEAVLLFAKLNKR